MSTEKHAHSYYSDTGKPLQRLSLGPRRFFAKNRLRMFLVTGMCVFLTAFVPTITHAHEVYVLSPREIGTVLSSTSPNPFTAVQGQSMLFLGWGAGIAVLVLVVLSLSVSRPLERIFDPFLKRLKRYAPFFGRLTLGASLLASGYYGALFGPELPLSQVLTPALAGPAGVLLMALGAATILGVYVRPAALIAVGFYLLSVFEDKLYMLNYANYLGEMILFLILGAGAWSLGGGRFALHRLDRAFAGLKRRFEPYAFLILRVLFGTAVVFASFYAKFLHSGLALQTVSDYHLTQYFPFTPLFLVLGAFLVEAVIGISIAIGFELRFITIVFTCFLTASILFFGEAVWPHIILFGVNAALFCHGYDRYTLDHLLFRRRRGEPVL